MAPHPLLIPFDGNVFHCHCVRAIHMKFVLFFYAFHILSLAAPLSGSAPICPQTKVQNNRWNISHYTFFQSYVLVAVFFLPSLGGCGAKIFNHRQVTSYSFFCFAFLFNHKKTHVIHL